MLEQMLKFSRISIGRIQYLVHISDLCICGHGLIIVFLRKAFIQHFDLRISMFYDNLKLCFLFSLAWVGNEWRRTESESFFPSFHVLLSSMPPSHFLRNYFVTECQREMKLEFVVKLVNTHEYEYISTAITQFGNQETSNNWKNMLNPYQTMISLYFTNIEDSVTDRFYW